jgi:hypothetical protein
MEAGNIGRVRKKRQSQLIKRGRCSPVRWRSPQGYIACPGREDVLVMPAPNESSSWAIDNRYPPLTHASLQKRLQEGRTLRRKVPRKSHAGCTAAPHRP